MKFFGHSFLGTVMLLLLCGSLAQAALTTYTSEADFLADVAGYEQETLNFEDMAPGSLVQSGDTIGWVTFAYDIENETMMVTDSFSTTSGANALGLTGGDDALLDGDTFSLSFGRPVNALGMSFVTSDPAVQGEIQLSTDVGSAFNSEDKTDLDDGGYAYFVGLNSSDSFSGAQVLFADDGQHFVYTVDDVTTAAVPIPGTLLLFGSGIFGMAFLKRRQPGK